MPRERFSSLPSDARDRLLRTATRHFAKLGLERASLNEILSEANMSKGSFYYYFDDKDDLYATTFEAGFDATFATQPMPTFEGVRQEEFWPTVERFVNEWALALDSATDLVQVAVHLTEAQRRSPRFAPMLAKAQAMYRTLIEAGQRLGCIRTDLPIEVLVRLLEANDAALDAVFLSMHAKVTRSSLEKHVNLVFDTFKRLLVVTPADAISAAKPRRKSKTRRTRG